MTTSIAHTILEQLGGNKFRVMTGAKQFVSLGNGLQFKLPARFAKKNINLITIKLDDSDTYTVEFMTQQGTFNIMSRAKHEGVYCDMLQRLFTEETGLDTHL